MCARRERERETEKGETDEKIQTQDVKVEREERRLGGELKR
jgi:hypothetical protein